MASFNLDSLLVFHEDKATSSVKTKSGMAKIPGKRCGGGWTKSTNKCKDESTTAVGSSGKKVRKLTPEGKKAAEELAAKVRKIKGLPVLPSAIAKDAPESTRKPNPNITQRMRNSAKFATDDDLKLRIAGLKDVFENERATPDDKERAKNFIQAFEEEQRDRAKGQNNQSAPRKSKRTANPESAQLVKAMKGTDEKLAALKEVPARMKKERLKREKTQSAKTKIKPVAALKAGIKAQKAVASGDGRAGFEAANEMRANLGLKPVKMSDRAAKTLANREAKLSVKTENKIAAAKAKAANAANAIASAKSAEAILSAKERQTEREERKYLDRETGVVGGKASIPGAVKVDRTKVKEAKLPAVNKQADFDKYLKAHVADLNANHNQDNYIKLKDLEDRMGRHGVSKDSFREMLSNFTQKSEDAILSDSGEKKAYVLNIGGLKRDSLRIDKPKEFKEMPDLESWAKSARGKKTGEIIEGPEGFNLAASDYLKKKGDGELVVIHDLRTAIGDRITRKEFNTYLSDMAANDKVQLMGSDLADITAEQAASAVSPGPGIPPRMLVKLL